MFAPAAAAAAPSPHRLRPHAYKVLDPVSHLYLVMRL